MTTQKRSPELTDQARRYAQLRRTVADQARRPHSSRPAFGRRLTAWRDSLLGAGLGTLITTSLAAPDPAIVAATLGTAAAAGALRVVRQRRDLDDPFYDGTFRLTGWHTRRHLRGRDAQHDQVADQLVTLALFADLLTHVTGDVTWQNDVLELTIDTRHTHPDNVGTVIGELDTLLDTWVSQSRNHLEHTIAEIEQDAHGPIAAADTVVAADATSHSTVAEMAADITEMGWDVQHRIARTGPEATRAALTAAMQVADKLDVLVADRAATNPTVADLADLRDRAEHVRWLLLAAATVLHDQRTTDPTVAAVRAAADRTQHRHLANTLGSAPGSTPGSTAGSTPGHAPGGLPAASAQSREPREPRSSEPDQPRAAT